MESNTKLNSQNFQNLHDFEWPFHEDLFLFDKGLDLPPLGIDHFFDLNFLSSSFQWDYNIFSPETEIFSPEKQNTTIPHDHPPLYEDHTAVAGEVEPMKAMIKSKEEDERSIREMEEVTRMIERGFPICWKNDEKRLRIMRLSNGRRKKRSKSSVLELEEIQQHFHIPISEAAKQMNVGLTLLKKRCRELNIVRWPHRKLKSLKSLIQNVKVMGLTNEVNGLEEHKRLVEELPNMDLTHRTKRLRQACFKANYKIKRRLTNIAAIH